MNNTPSLLGILGGLGPMSGVYFCEMLTAHTYALSDREHINFLLSSRADTPDRSSYILGQSSDNPCPIMEQEALRLERAGAQVLAIPCNTAHYFYSRICNAVTIPVINIIEEAARFAKFSGAKCVGVLATEGTLASCAYEKFFTPLGIKIERPTAVEQQIITDIIFSEIKCGKQPSLDKILSVCRAMHSRGCESVILGCTELSIIKGRYALPDYVFDSLELLALRVITLFKKQPCGFDLPLMSFYGSAEKGNR